MACWKNDLFTDHRIGALPGSNSVRITKMEDELKRGGFFRQGSLENTLDLLHETRNMVFFLDE